NPLSFHWQTYSVLNNTVSWGSGPVRLHAGLHLISLHQGTGQVMMADSYKTWQTTIDTIFLQALRKIQDGRLLVILGAPDFSMFLEKTTIAALEELGAYYVETLAYKEAWCLVVYKGSGVVLEALTTSLPQHNLTRFDVSPLTVRTAVPRMQ
ncbi:O-linked-mannose beta-1-2-N-acetylglucosaminyltransferase 1-like 8, partial [Homarus americanus]